MAVTKSRAASSSAPIGTAVSRRSAARSSHNCERISIGSSRNRDAPALPNTRRHRAGSGILIVHAPGVDAAALPAGRKMKRARVGRTVRPLSADSCEFSKPSVRVQTHEPLRLGRLARWCRFWTLPGITRCRPVPAPRFGAGILRVGDSDWHPAQAIVEARLRANRPPVV